MRTAGILLFDDVELATFADAVTLFGAEGDGSGGGTGPRFRPVLIAKSRRPVACRGGFSLQPQATIGDHPPLDVLLIPGAHGPGWEWPTSRVIDQMDVLLRPQGLGVRRERHNPQLIHWIRDQSRRVEAVIGICRGIVLLAEYGLLMSCDGASATVFLDASVLSGCGADSREGAGGRRACNHSQRLEGRLPGRAALYQSN